MREYVLGVCGAVLISALVTLLLPEGKTGKFIHGILKLFCLVVILVPLLAFFKNFSLSSGGSTESSMTLDENFIEYAAQERAESDGKALKSELEQIYKVVVKVRVVWEIDENIYIITGVEIKIEDFGIYENDEHIIIIDQIAEYVRTKTGLDKTVVKVYE